MCLSGQCFSAHHPFTDNVKLVYSEGRLNEDALTLFTIAGVIQLSSTFTGGAGGGGKGISSSQGKMSV